MVSDGVGEKRLGELKNIIDFAIEKEQEAVEFYTDIAGKVKTKALSGELRKIAAMEEGHRDRLKKMDVGAAAMSVAKPVMDLHIAEYTVNAKPSPDMSWSDIVNIAIHRELASINLYADLGKLVSDPLAKKMFENLVEEEKAHKLFFEKIWDDEILTSN